MPILLLGLLKQVIIYLISSGIWRWIRTTKVGAKTESGVMKVLNWVSRKLDIELIKKNTRFSKHYPYAHERIKKLESRMLFLENQLKHK